jgi:hypothetical protein
VASRPAGPIPITLGLIISGPTAALRASVRRHRSKLGALNGHR